MAVNYTIFYGTYTLFGVEPGLGFYTLLVIAAVSYPLAAMIERVVSNNYTRVFYTVASSWMGISFYVLTVMAVYWLLSIFIKIPGEVAGTIIIVLSALLSGYSLINSGHIDIKHVNIPLNGLERKVRAVQLSDIHIGSIRNSEYLEEVVEKTNKIDPELVLITGDMVDGSARLHTHTFNAINQLKAPVFFIMGNHETYEGLDEVLRVLRGVKMKILRDQMVEFNGIQIIGVEYSFERNHMKNVLSKVDIDQSKPSIVLYHTPTELEATADAGVGLQLSGHTHAGQMLPFNYLVRLMFRYMNGMYKYKDTYLYVSPGTGTWGPPMRLGSRCEITVLDLEASKA
ncbi:MAG: metallophosphoesterase [Methanobacterium sp. ERen5]|nr:MAG: metallophosphoesterase [Methanobacterium sp. ERen5]